MPAKKKKKVDHLTRIRDEESDFSSEENEKPPKKERRRNTEIYHERDLAKAREIKQKEKEERRLRRLKN